MTMATTLCAARRPMREHMHMEALYGAMENVALVVMVFQQCFYSFLHLSSHMVCIWRSAGSPRERKEELLDGWGPRERGCGSKAEESSTGVLRKCSRVRLVCAKILARGAAQAVRA